MSNNPNQQNQGKDVSQRQSSQNQPGKSQADRDEQTRKAGNQDHGDKKRAGSDY